MILDPNRNGIEVWYDNKLRNLEGGIEECTAWILECCLDETKDYYGDEVGYILESKGGNIVHFKDKKYLQQNSDKIYLDMNGIGGLWRDYFEHIGFVVHKLDAKRVVL